MFRLHRQRVHRLPGVAILVGALAAAFLTTAPAAHAASAPTVVTGGSELTIRSGPTSAARVLGTINNGTRVTISCQADGSRVTGTFGISTLWDRVTAGSSYPAGYVSDTYVRTGSDGRVAPQCVNPDKAGRKPVREWSTSSQGVSFIKHFEASGPPRLYPYDDGGDPSNCTVGWGHVLGKGRLCTAAEKRRRFTVGQVTAFFRSDITRIEGDLDRAIPRTPVTSSEFDALVSFVFNVGPAGFAGPRLPSNVYLDLQGRPYGYELVYDHLRAFGKPQFAALPGLRIRRLAEARLFRDGNYSTRP